MTFSRKFVALAAGISAVTAGIAIGCAKKSSSPELIAIPIQVDYTGTALNLAGLPATSFKINVTGCESAYTPPQVTTTPAYLYKHDLSCAAGLEEFVYATKTWTKVGGGDLTGAAGASANFTDGSDTIKVVIIDQLSSPLVTADKITFNFFEIKGGTDNAPGKASYSEGHAVAVEGVEAPNFEISAVTLDGMAAGGIPTYGIEFECQVAIADADTTCPTANADNQAMANMDVKIVEDTYAGTPSYADAETVFGTAGTAPAVDPAIGVNGGMSVSIAGPGPLYNKKNTIVFIRFSPGTGGSSYTYFNMDIGDPGAP